MNANPSKSSSFLAELGHLFILFQLEKQKKRAAESLSLDSSQDSTATHQPTAEAAGQLLESTPPGRDIQIGVVSDEKNG